MNTDAIVQKILADAREDAAQTLLAANERANALREQSDARIEERRMQLMRQNEVDCQLLRSRMLRMAELDQRKEMLGAKREVIEQVFDTVLGALISMPGERRKAYNRQLLLQAAMGGEELIFDAEDAALFDDEFLAGANRELQNLGKQPVSRAQAHRKTGGGFVLKRGGMEVNCTYRAIINQMKPDLEAEVATALFGQEAQ